MAMQLLLLIVFAGIVNSHFSCLTWTLNGNNLSLICRIQTKNQTVSFIDSYGKLQAKCTFNNLSKCESFHINGSITANVHLYKVVFMIKEYKDTKYINEEWTCSQSGTLWKTVVSTSGGTSEDTNIRLSGILSLSLHSVTLRCFSCREPYGNNADFMKDDKSEDSVYYNSITNKCTHIMGECQPETCSCSQSGNEFIRNFSVAKKYTKFTCGMKFVDSKTSFRFWRYSSIILKGKELIDNGNQTIPTIRTDNGQEVNDGNRNVSDDRNNVNRTVSTPNTVEPEEVIKWIFIGAAFIIPFVVFGVVIARSRPFANTKRRTDEELPLLGETELFAPQDFDIVQWTDSSITFKWIINNQLLVFEIRYRRQGSSHWNIIIISTEDISADNDGHLVYKLQNLLPETYYELKMCSIYGHAKSQYTIYRTQRTRSLAPKHFDIVQCTDNSITIEWISPVLTMSYEIHYRCQGSDNWNNLQIPTVSVSKKKDGHLFWKLQNLLPDTHYELQMCSIDRNVKSQYTESKTGRTLQIAPKHFDIVQCTDVAITIEWDINDQVLPMAYEICYRRQEADDWNIMSICTEDILLKGNRHLLYKIQGLLPVTHYELKMCSIYRNVKSQYTESKTVHTLQIAPKHFDILQCSDCSITVKWDSGDTDSCLGYELCYRMQGLDEWNTLPISIEDISTKGDEGLVYTLQDLLPETCYELKMCSIGKHAKSQDTKSRRQHTLKLYQVMSGRKRTSTSRKNSGVAEAATKKAKHQHLGASSNIQARKVACTQGQSKTTVTLAARISTATATCSVDTINTTPATNSLNQITTSTTVLATEIIYQRCARDMSFLTLSEENKHLSAFLNANVISLACAKLQQYYIKRHNDINEIICGLLKIPERTIVGSMAEGLNMGSDIDTILLADKSCVFDGLCFMPEPEKRHPGYSKLRVFHVSCTQNKLIEYMRLKDDKFYLTHYVKELFVYPSATHQCPNGLSIHGPAYNTLLCDQFNQSRFQNTEIISFDSDFVFCIKSKDWPFQALEWMTRRRASNWPTKEIFSHIIDAGCFLAAVGSKESNEMEMQWRVSFNKAEQLIIGSFNETQIHCILLLKLLKSCLSHIAGKNITSYTMKTVMFWCLEEKSVDFWQSSNLVCCFCFCVSKLKSFVEKGFLPNYFIRKQNQFVASEFNCDIQTKTIQYLESLLIDSKAGIRFLLPLYRKHANTQICTFEIRSKENVIIRWLINQKAMALAFAGPSKLGSILLARALNNEYNTQYILKRCNETLDKLKTVGYAQHLIKKLRNQMGVLQYIRLKEKNETGEHKTDSDTREQYSKYMTLSASGYLTDNALRMATCYLDDCVKEECLNIIRKVTDLDDQFVMQIHSQRLKQTFNCDIQAFIEKQHSAVEIALYNMIIYDIDFKHQDPYQTTAAFELLKENGHVLIGYDSLSLAWKQSYFDVTFIVAELPILPKPAALELCIDFSQKYISFHPFLYGLLLEFLWHHKYGLGNEEKESVLEKMKTYVSNIPVEQQSRGLNFVTYCCSLQKDFCSASKYMIQSFKVNPVRENVAYLYIQYITKLFRMNQTSGVDPSIFKQGGSAHVSLLEIIDPEKRFGVLDSNSLIVDTNEGGPTPGTPPLDPTQNCIVTFMGA